MRPSKQFFFVVGPALAIALGCAGPTPPAKTHVLDTCDVARTNITRARAAFATGKLDRVTRILATTPNCATTESERRALQTQALAELDVRPTLAPHADLASAHRAFDEGRFDEALASFESALEADPAHMRALVGAGLVYLQKGDMPRARRLLDRAQSRLEAETGDQGRPVLVLPATENEVDIGVEYIPYAVRSKGGTPGNVGVLFPDNSLGHVLLEPRGAGWNSLRWLGMTAFSSRAGTVGRIDEAGTVWIVRPNETQDLRIGAYSRGSLSPDGTRLYVCNASESIIFELPEGKTIGRRASGCVGRYVYSHVAWNESGTLLFESARGDNVHSSDAAHLVVSAVPSFEPVFEDDHAVIYGNDEPRGRIFVKRKREGDDWDIVFVDARQRKILTTHSGRVGALNFRPDGAKVGLDGESMAIVDLTTNRVEDLGKKGSSSMQLGTQSSAPHFTSDGRYCVERHGKWRLHAPRAPRTGQVQYCFPHADGSATVVPIPVTKGFVLPSDTIQFDDFQITESLAPDRRTAAIIEQTEQKKPVGTGYIAPERFLVLVDVPSGAIRHRIPLGRFFPNGNGTFVVGPSFSADGNVVTVPTGEREVTSFYVATGALAPAEPRLLPDKHPRSPHELTFTEHPFATNHDVLQFDGNRALFLEPNAAITLVDIVKGIVIRTERRPGLCFGSSTGSNFNFATCDGESERPGTKLFLRSSTGGDHTVSIDAFLSVATHGNRVAVSTIEGITIFARKKDAFEQVATLPTWLVAGVFSERGDHVVAGEFSLSHAGDITVFALPGGKVRFQSENKSCDHFRMLPGDLIQCGHELLDLDGTPIKRPADSPPIVLHLHNSGRKMTVDEGGDKPIERPVDALLWTERAKDVSRWSESTDGRLLFVAHDHGIVTVHAMDDGARRMVLVPTRNGHMAFLPGGYVEIEGKPLSNLVCRFGDVLVPFAVCAERRTVTQGIAKAIAADSSYDEP